MASFLCCGRLWTQASFVTRGVHVVFPIPPLDIPTFTIMSKLKVYFCIRIENSRYR